jgi:Zn-dependent M16 (insulinase) family peptidase
MLRLLTHRASLHTSKYNWQPGDRFLSFQLLSTSPLSDHNSHLHHLKHLPTNSQIIHIEKADPNNCFAPIVQTLANNNKGAPHILEHLACCGSEKFPVRDPFFNMLKRSLNTYMNAWTGSDFTCYPFSTGNRKDFGNLMRVYLDMVFRPRLDYLDFRQ